MRNEQQNDTNCRGLYSCGAFLNHDLAFVSIKCSHRSFRQSNLIVRVPDSQAGQNRDIQLTEELVHDFAKRESRIEPWLEIVWLASAAFAKDYTCNVFEFPGQAQLRQHSVDAIWLFSDVFHK